MTRFVKRAVEGFLSPRAALVFAVTAFALGVACWATGQPKYAAILFLYALLDWHEWRRAQP